MANARGLYNPKKAIVDEGLLKEEEVSTPKKTKKSTKAKKEKKEKKIKSKK